MAGRGWSFAEKGMTDHPVLATIASMATAIGIIAGGLITILTAIGIEYLRRPVLQLIIETPPLDLPSPSNPAKIRRHLRLKLQNEPLPKIWRWTQRAAALQCRGEITFHNLDGQAFFDRAMAVRWASAPEPIASQIVDPAEPQEPKFFILDFARAATESRTDVYPGEEEVLDVAVRFDDEADCYGWNNDSYFYNWRNPNWRLPRERYLIKVVVTSSGQKCVGKFRLINNVDSRADFRLTELLPEDRAKRF
jgi:hypothetical protein